MDKKRIVKNLVVLAFVEVINKSVPLLLLYLVPKRLGLLSFGFSQIGLTLVESAVPLVALGYQYIAALEVGKNPRDKLFLGNLSSNLISLRLLQATISYAALLLFCWLLPQYRSYVPFVSIWGLILFITAIEMSYIQMGTKNYHWNMFVQGVGKILSLVSIFLFVHSADDILLFGVFYLLPNAIICFASVLFSHRRVQWVKPQFTAMKNIFKKSFTLALIFVGLTLFERIDVLIVGKMFGLETVGIYAGASRLGQALSQSLVALTTLFYSELVSDLNRNKLTQLINLNLFIMSALMFPIMAGVWFVDGDILSFMLNGSAGTHGFLLSAAVQGVLFYGVLLSLGLQVLLPSKETKIFAKFLMGGCMIQFVACYIASHYSVNYVILSSISSKALTAGLVFWASKKYLGTIHWFPILKNALALIPMLAALYYINPSEGGVHNHIVLCVLVAAPIYGISLLILNYRMVHELFLKVKKSLFSKKVETHG